MKQIGRYQILGELGRGAMGVVYRALDPAIGRPVAIKTIRLRDITDDSERERLRERLFREAQSAGIISHPGIVTVYDVGDEDEVTYIAMEYVDGPTLDKLMSGTEPLEPARGLAILKQTAAALDFAHKKGIVHRDIKPANIMLTAEGAAKITDFGVAKIAQSQQMTQAGTVVGTPNYMSPEQLQGLDVDGRTDQFALAVITYELLTGEKPFAGEHLTSVLYKIVSEEPPPPHTLNPTLPWTAGMVLSRALSKDPVKRFPTATEFIQALEAALGARKDWKLVARGAGESAPTAISPLAAAPEPDAPPPPARPQRRKGGGLFWKMLAAAGAGLLFVAAVFFAAQKWAGPEPGDLETPEPPPAAAQSTRPAPMPPPVMAPAQPSVTDTEAAAATEGQAEQASGATTKPAEPPETEPEQAKPEPVREPVQRGPAKPEPAVEHSYALQVVTNPPGATSMIDNDPAKTCRTPCSTTLSAGRHTVAVDLPGYRRELRIIELTSPREMFINMTRNTGTVRVGSNPPGAQIMINNQLRKETTPASFTLPIGKYRISVIKDGRRADQEIDVREGSLLTYELDLNP
ncbi:MAG TPA: serine/threonine-protein kinase [Bryobacteraceae bacterium]|nr:serine/threonine-protein kinase [Bryobacteraceae bacterium]